ncbi:uncharacterized protein [Anoplolepis gracilipes]|uniref:uncharacterized protein n=1 Tax=Anoplolepis gracilipes TaxID=354296 RepID=UPI003BA153EC
MEPSSRTFSSAPGEVLSKTPLLLLSGPHTTVEPISQSTGSCQKCHSVVAHPAWIDLGKIRSQKNLPLSDPSPVQHFSPPKREPPPPSLLELHLALHSRPGSTAQIDLAAVEGTAGIAELLLLPS